MLKPFSKDTSGRLNRRFPEEWNETIFTLFWKIIFTCLSSSPAGWSSSFSCVSTIFEKNCPADAVCARYGGGEFALILPAPPCFLKRLIKPCMRQNEAGKTA